MICPSCKTDNIDGSDVCEACGYDLRHVEVSNGEHVFREHIMHDRLGELGEEPPVVTPSEPVAFAIHIMQRHETGCVLVIERDELVGILTERDVLLKAAADKVDLNAVAVRDIMTADPVILRDEDTLAVALHKMSIGGFRHIPLEREGRKTSVVSIQDVFRHVCAVMDEESALTS